MNKPGSLGRGAVLASVLVCSSSWAAVLPSIDATFDGIQVANRFDDFYGYSTDLMTQLQTEGHMSDAYGQFDFSTGTGTLDVLLYTGSGGHHEGQSNQGVGPGGTHYFEDPVYDPGGSRTEFEGWWGQRDQDGDGVPDDGATGNDPDVRGPVTVGAVIDYLNAFDPDNNTPFFYADINQTGGDVFMTVSINAMILDPVTREVLASWSMDSLLNGNYDPGSPVGVDNFSVTGTSGHVYNVDVAKGSGHADFIFFAPGMDLSLFNRNSLFVMNGAIGSLNDGFEEFFLTGALSYGQAPVPSALWLTMLGLLGLWRVRTR